MSRVSNVVVSVDLTDEPLMSRFSDWLAGVEAEDDWVRLGSAKGVGSLAKVTSYGGWKHPEWALYAGALNLADHGVLREWFAAAEWEYPENAQLWLRDEEEDFFSLWMFRHGALTRVTPAPSGVDGEIYLPAAPRHRLRLGGHQDVDLLAALAERWLPASEGWAEHITVSETRRRVGALPGLVSVIVLKELDCSDPDTWLWTGEGAGFLRFSLRPGGATEARLALAVPPEIRGLGAGRPLLTRLLDITADQEISRLAAVVPEGDEWLVRTFTDAGFTVAGSHGDSGRSGLVRLERRQ